MKRRLALACAVLLGAMIVDDVRALIHRQRTMDCDVRLCRHPRDLEQYTRAYHDPRISGRLANFYYLRQNLRGATITIPPWMEPWDRYFTEIARMSFVESNENMIVADAEVDRLTQMARHRRKWLRRAGSRPLHQDIYIVHDPAATEYVWAETSRSYFGPVLILPADVFAAAREVKP